MGAASRARVTKAGAVIYAGERETQLRRDTTSSVQHDRTFDETFRRYETEVSAFKPGKRWEAIRLSFYGRYEINGVKLRDMTLSAVTSDALGQIRNQRLTVDKVTGSTVIRDFNLLSAVFWTAVDEWKWIAASPTTDVRRPKEAAPRDRLPTDDEVERICSALGFDLGGDESAATTTSQAVAVMLLFTIETAMRSGDICQLEPQWVDGNVARLSALATKNRTKRDVPLSKGAVELLTRLPVSADGTLFGISSASRDALFRKATRRAMIEGLTLHDSRHLAITKLSKKLDILALTRMVGHRDLRQLQVYYNESAKDIANRFD